MGGGGPANLKKTKGQGHEHFCDDTGMPARNGNFGTLTEIQQQRRHVCENNWVRKIASIERGQEKK